MITRRDFLIRSSVLAAAGMILPDVVQAADPNRIIKQVAPSDRLRVALVGCRNMGWSNLSDFLGTGEVDCVALCDVDRSVMQNRAKEVSARQSKEPLLFGDYRRVLDLKDVDAVIIGTPDHWHCLQMVDACAAGKDVYVEKPIANSIAECDLMTRAASRYKRIVSVGQQQRSGNHWKSMIDYLQSGALGKIARIDIWANFAYGALGKPRPDATPSADLDYEMWQGPAPRRPYNDGVLPGSWRMFWNYGGGLMTDWGVHLIDMALWAMNETSMPRRVAGIGGKYAYPDHSPETFDTQTVVYQFDDYLIQWNHTAIESGPYGRNYGLAFKGTNGTLVADRSNWEVIPDNQGNRPKIEIAKDIADGLDHQKHVKNFIDCAKNRDFHTACTIDNGSLCAKYAHLGNIAARSGQTITYDDKCQTFRDKKIDEYITPRYTKPWRLPKF